MKNVYWQSGATIYHVQFHMDATGLVAIDGVTYHDERPLTMSLADFLKQMARPSRRNLNHACRLAAGLIKPLNPAGYAEWQLVLAAGGEMRRPPRRKSAPPPKKPGGPRKDTRSPRPERKGLDVRSEFRDASRRRW